jgi:Thioesterase-like superfamily
MFGAVAGVVGPRERGMDEQAGCYYAALDGEGRFRATGATAGPWDPAMQHGGPPAALLASLIERCDPQAGLRLARITVELLAPVPVDELRVQARVVRPGRRVRLVEATLEVGGRPMALARAWQMTSQPDVLPPPASAEVPPQLPDRSAPLATWREGYASSIEWRFVSGAFHKPGPAEVWARVRIPLIREEPLTGLERLLIVADSANGISSVLAFADWLFVPTALTVTLHRHPSGEWVFMRARTSLATDGVGSCLAELADADGFIGTATQPLLVARRETPSGPGSPVPGG